MASSRLEILICAPPLLAAMKQTQYLIWVKTCPTSEVGTATAAFHYLKWCLLVMRNTTTSFSFSSVQDGVMAVGKAHTRSVTSLNSLPKIVLEKVAMFVWLNTDHSRLRRVERRPLPFTSPLFFGLSVLWYSDLAMFQKIPRAPKHFCPAKLQTKCSVWCACQSVYRQHKLTKSVLYRKQSNLDLDTTLTSLSTANTN